MSDLRERVAHAMWHQGVDAAIDLVLEEAARVVRRMPSPSSEWMADELLRALGGPANQVPEDIRALKSKP